MIEDAYAELGMARKLVLSGDEARARFQEMSRVCHPDAGGDAVGYQRLVEALAILESPAARLRHWCALAGKPVSSGIVDMDPEIVELFPRVADAVQAGRAAVLKKSSASSALARAMAERLCLKAMERLEEAMASCNAIFSACEKALMSLDRVDVDPTAVGRLANTFTYLEKWKTEIRQVMAQLI